MGASATLPTWLPGRSTWTRGKSREWREEGAGAISPATSLHTACRWVRVVTAKILKAAYGQIMSPNHWHRGISDTRHTRHHYRTARQRTDPALRRADGVRDTLPILTEALVELNLGRRRWRLGCTPQNHRRVHHGAECLAPTTSPFICGVVCRDWARKKFHYGAPGRDRSPTYDSQKRGGTDSVWDSRDSVNGRFTAGSGYLSGIEFQGCPTSWGALGEAAGPTPKGVAY
jgi:hypothetical protein